MIKLTIENIKVAFSSIRTQLLRTILTILIIAIGITALVGILTVVAALENTLSTNFASMGANTFNINQYNNSIRESGDGETIKINPLITYSEAKKFKENYNFPLSNTSISFVATSNAEVKFETKKTDPEISVLGIDDYFLGNSGLELETGRNFTSFDIQNNTFSCIIGSDFKKGLFKNTDPIEKKISIRGAKFKIIGVLKEKGSTFRNSQDLRVLIPIQIARSIFSNPNINYNISVITTQEQMLNEAVNEAKLSMRMIRKLYPIEEDNFGITRSDDLLNKISEIGGVLNASAWIIGIITIFGSSIALMNIMLVSVTERTREIGVRKALGAKKSTIAFQFFVETLIIGQLGGIVGVILGILIGFGISTAIDFKFIVPWGAILAAFVTTFIVAIFSGLYPAIKASKLDPIEALRYE